MSAALAVIDLMIVHAWRVGSLGTPQSLSAHILAVVAVGGAMLLLPGTRIRTAVSLLVCLLLGPVGGIVLVVSDLGRVRQDPQPAHVDVPAASRAERLHAEILQGRRRRGRGRPTASFATVFASGTLAEKQAAVAAISLSYRPEMLPGLRLALASDVPAIRVQAAAAYAKLRGSFIERAKAALAAAARGDGGETLVAEAHAVATSGFLDAETVSALVELTQRARTPGHGARKRTREPLKSDGRQATPAPDTPVRRLRGGALRPPRMQRYSCGGVA
jgi:hypothetical protein